MPSSPSGRTRSAAGPRPSRSTRWRRPDEGEGGARRALAGVSPRRCRAPPCRLRLFVAVGQSRADRHGLHQLWQRLRRCRSFSPTLRARWSFWPTVTPKRPAKSWTVSSSARPLPRMKGDRMAWDIEVVDGCAVVRMNTNKVNVQNDHFFGDLHAAFDRLEHEFSDLPVVLTG